MQLYLDSANLDEIEEIASWQVLSGLTTNPSLLGKQGISIAAFMERAIRCVNGPISLEVLADDAPTMIEEAQQLKTYGEQVVIKVPLTAEGLKAQAGIKGLGLDTNLTLVFSTNQALLAAAAGASYVSPFMGRLDDNGFEGKALIAEIATIFEQYTLPTKIIAASLRTARDVTDAALAGADIATIPYAIFKKMIDHPLTSLGIERFKADWEKGGITSL